MNCKSQASEGPICGKVFSSPERKFEIVKKLIIDKETRAGTAPLSTKNDDQPTVTLCVTKIKSDHFSHSKIE